MIEISGRAVRLCVGTPTRDNRVHAAHAECLRAMEIGCRASGIDFMRATAGGYDVADQRCTLAQAARRWEATHVLMLDEDVALPGQDPIGKLLSALASTDALIAAACCLSKPATCDRTGRAERTPPLASQYEEIDTGERYDIAVSGADTLITPEGYRLLCGAGAVLIDARAFLLFGPDERAFRFVPGLSEDWYFAREVQRRGGAAVLVPSVETVHYGVTGWRWRA